MTSKFITRNKNSKPKPETHEDKYSAMNSPVTVKRIEDYSAEDQARWFNIKPTLDSEGKPMRRPIMTNLMQKR